MALRTNPSTWTLLVLLGLLSTTAASGCGGDVEQRAACADYVACIEARDVALGYETDVVRFRPEGECWGGEQGADLCETACVQGLEYLREKEPGLPEECQ